MNRTDRLYALAEELRRAGRAGTTGRRLAHRFEVSERTIKRDISSLQQAGLPIWAQAGPGGGYVLDAAATLPPVNFTSRQAVAVAIALAILPPGSPFSQEAQGARAKIWDTLGEGAADRARELASRIWVDHSGIEPVDRGPGGIADRANSYLRHAAAVEESLATKRVLAIGYRDSRGAETSRRVEPILLAYARGQWYVVAHDQLRQAVRWFALARLTRADVTAESYLPLDVDVVGEPPAQARPVS